MTRHCRETPKCVIECREVSITLLFVGIDSEELNLIFVIVRGGLRVESNPALCGHLNGDVGTFAALNFGNKSLSLAVFTFISSCSCIAYLGLLILLSEITCLDLAPEFIMLPTCYSRSFCLYLVEIVLE
jgi:hypothetical protein